MTVPLCGVDVTTLCFVRICRGRPGSLQSKQLLLTPRIVTVCSSAGKGKPAGCAALFLSELSYGRELNVSRSYNAFSLCAPARMCFPLRAVIDPSLVIRFRNF